MTKSWTATVMYIQHMSAFPLTASACFASLYRRMSGERNDGVRLQIKMRNEGGNSEEDREKE
jgi:hypothetical protein